MRRLEHSLIIRSQTDRLILTTQKLDRSQVKRVERPHGEWEGLQCTGQHRLSQLDQS